MTFGDAIEALKAGHKIARDGWNGKGMNVSLRHEEGYEACFVLLNAQGRQQPGWNASTADVLAEDWTVAAS